MNNIGGMDHMPPKHLIRAVFLGVPSPVFSDAQLTAISGHVIDGDPRPTS